MNLNELAAQVHQANIKWWQDPATGKPIQRNKGELLMLVITELAEAVEGIRKNLMDDKLPHRRMEEVEMADAYIRLLDYAGGFGLTLEFYDSTAEDLCAVSENKSCAILDICEYVCEVSQKARGSIGVSYCLWRIRNYCENFDLDLDGAIKEKLAYNATRHDHTHEARRADGGKMF